MTRPWSAGCVRIFCGMLGVAPASSVPPDIREPLILMSTKFPGNHRKEFSKVLWVSWTRLWPGSTPLEPMDQKAFGNPMWARDWPKRNETERIDLLELEQKIPRKRPQATRFILNLANWKARHLYHYRNLDVISVAEDTPKVQVYVITTKPVLRSGHTIQRRNRTAPHSDKPMGLAHSRSHR